MSAPKFRARCARAAFTILLRLLVRHTFTILLRTAPTFTLHRPYASPVGHAHDRAVFSGIGALYACGVWLRDCLLSSAPYGHSRARSAGGWLSHAPS